MLDVLETKRESLALIKKGCAEVKRDSSKALLIQQGISKLKSLPNDDIFNNLICAIGYEKMKKFGEAVSEYDCCISSLPNCSIKYGITGMKYRTLAKGSTSLSNDYVNMAIECYKKALAAESDYRWKMIWQESIEEIQRML